MGCSRDGSFTRQITYESGGRRGEEEAGERRGKREGQGRNQALERITKERLIECVPKNEAENREQDEPAAADHMVARTTAH